MRKIIKRTAKIGSVLAFSVILFTAASTTFAQTLGSSTANSGSGPRPRFHINSNGKTVIFGTVESVSDADFKVNTPLGTWSIDTDTNTKFALANTAETVKPGDNVMVFGSVLSADSRVVTATRVGDPTLRKEIREERKEVRQLRKQHRL
jgi:hypothetical protein